MEYEIWKDIIGYEGLYLISSLGTVKSLPKTWVSANGGIRRAGEKIRVISLNHKGYYGITLSDKGKNKYFFVHRLVATHFIPNDGNKEQVNHKNGIKTDNRVDNLEWCTQSENQLHSYQIGLKWPRKGAENKQSIPVLATNLATNETTRFSNQAEAASVLKLGRGNVMPVIAGRRRMTGGYHFKYI